MRKILLLCQILMFMVLLTFRIIVAESDRIIAISIESPNNKFIICENDSTYLIDGILPKKLIVKENLFSFINVLEEMMNRKETEDVSFETDVKAIFYYSDGSSRATCNINLDYVRSVFRLARRNILGPDFIYSHVYGLVEVPRAFDAINQGGILNLTSLKESEQIPLYVEPSHDSDKIVNIRDPNILKTTEHGYEIVSAIVYGEIDGWYLIRYFDGLYEKAAWLSPHDAGEYYPLKTLFLNKLAFLTANWDRRLWINPSGEAELNFSDCPPPTEIDVISSQYIDDALWLKIKVLDPEWCLKQNSPKATIGWLPAYSANGGLNVWFYSRGM